MKTLTRITLLLILLATVSSCFLEGITGDGNVVTQNRNISASFDAISASQALDVHLTIGDTPTVKLEVDENLLDVIETEVEDGVLRIYTNKNIRSATSRKIYVTANAIEEIKVTSAASVKCENLIKGDKLSLKATSAASLNLNVDVTDLSCNVTSAADVRIQGKADSFKASATSAAQIIAKELDVKTCNADVTSAANISVRVHEQLDANATSAGSIQYYGEPKKIQKKSTSGGSISS